MCEHVCKRKRELKRERVSERGGVRVCVFLNVECGVDNKELTANATMNVKLRWHEKKSKLRFNGNAFICD